MFYFSLLSGALIMKDGLTLMENASPARKEIQQYSCFISKVDNYVKLSKIKNPDKIFYNNHQNIIILWAGKQLYI